MRYLVPTLATIIFITAVGQPACADELQRTISVSGQGTASAPPDVATIQTGVVTQAAVAGEALAANSRAVKKIMEVLETHRIAAKDIQTSNFDVRPEYERGRGSGGGQRRPNIVGYRVTNQVRVRLRHLPDLGKVLDALVAAGSNQISGISFGIDDPSGVLNQARNRAVRDARSRAELYAHAAGVRLGKVISISEQAAPVPQPRMRGMMMAAEAASAVPVATGEQEMRTTVYMVFALEG